MKFNFIISTIKNSNKYYFCIVIILLSISCNKTDSYENLNTLIENEWNLFSREKNNINIIENCDLDDKLLFENRSTFSYEFGVLDCFENENKKTGLKWKIVDNHTTLREMDSHTRVTTTTMFHRDNRQIGFLLHHLQLIITTVLEVYF